MRLKTKDMVVISLFTSLTIVGAYIQIPFGLTPFTLQYLFVALAGVLLGSTKAAISQCLYVVLGLIGMPIFAGGGGGFFYVIHPTFGFLLGFIVTAFVIGKITERIKVISIVKLFLACLIGVGILYSIGIPYLYIVNKIYLGKTVNFLTVLKSFMVFLPGDVIKCIFTAVIGASLLPIVRRTIL